MNRKGFEFGIGWISKRIDLKDIESTRIVKNPWYYGMGIKVIPRGMLYNVHGFTAVELKYRGSNKILRLGAPDCQELKKAIDRQLDLQ